MNGRSRFQDPEKAWSWQTEISLADSLITNKRDKPNNRQKHSNCLITVDWSRRNVIADNGRNDRHAFSISVYTDYHIETVVVVIVTK